MIVLDEFKQGSPEWFQQRCGIPTASHFKELVTPKTRKPSAQAFGYLCRLVFERLVGEPYESESSSVWMDRGGEMEAEARRWYEWDRDCEVRQVGVVLRDDRSAGCSPDGLVGDDGLIEIKVPGGKVHVGYLLQADRLLADYVCQIQGELWICERQWCDLFSYHPSLPPVVLRVERDEELIEAIDTAVLALNAQMQEALASERFQAVPRPSEPSDPLKSEAFQRLRAAWNRLGEGERDAMRIRLDVICPDDLAERGDRAIQEALELIEREDEQRNVPTRSG